MGTCSIEIAGFADLVAGIESLRADLPGDEGSVRGALSGVLLSGSSLTPLEQVKSWADGEIRGLHRRLAMARMIEASTPGVQLYVQFDESTLSTKSDAEIAADVETVREWVEDGGGEIPEEVLAILEGGAADPYFARALAEQLDPAELGHAVRNAGAAGDYALDPWDPDYQAEREALIDRYDRLLSALGTTLGLASQGTGDVAPPENFQTEWIEAMTGEDRMPGISANLALVFSRGTWSSEMSVGLTQAIVELETGDDGMRGMWQMEAYPMGTYLGALTPDGQQAYDPLALVLQGVANNPEAAVRIFEESGSTTVTVDGQDHEVSSLMDYLISQRRWPVDAGAGAREVIMAGATPHEGGSVYSAVVASDARLAALAFEEEIIARAEEDQPWWSDVGHVVLDVLGMVPVIGEPADLVNGVWYYAEGNVIDGSLSIVALVPLGGQAATAGKWGRRVYRGADAVRLLEDLGNTPLDETLESVQLLARADNTAPGVFRFDNIDDFNRAANNAHPGVRYEYNDMAWTTDEFGRTTQVEGTLTTNPAGRDPSLQRDIGNGPDARDSDVGFHLIADSLGGPTNRLNVLPGNGRPIDDGLANLNQGAYSSMERQLRGALNANPPKEVSIELEAIYPPGSATTRPERFEVGAWIDGEWYEFGPFINK